MLVRHWRAQRDRWRTTGRRWRRVLDRRLALDRWYPQIVLAAMVAPLGLLLVAAAAETAFGQGFLSLDLVELEHRLVQIEHRPIIEIALGVSLVVMALGLALRSWLAWIWTVAVIGVGFALRVPPEPTDGPALLYLAGVFLLLLFHRRSFASRTVFASAVFALVALVAFSTWAVLGTLRLGEQFKPPVHDLATAFYLTVTTVSSVGFGDIVAREPEARLFVSAEILVGIFAVATAFSAILLPLIGGRIRRILGGDSGVERSSHYVVVGHSPLARNATSELEKRGKRVTMILSRPSEELFYKDRDVLVGDPSDLSVLRTAGVKEAKAVLALTTDDATNGFVVLGVNELDATVPTVAAVNDPSNHSRLKLTQPSMLLSLQSLGGELLAMALSGERVNVDMLSQVLQVHGAEGETGE